MELINKKTIGALLGALLVQLFFLGLFSGPAALLAQTTSPTPQPLDPLCRLMNGIECGMIDPRQPEPPFTQPRPYPAVEASNVPTFTLISVTFPRKLRAGAVSSDTLVVTDGTTRLPGAVDYLEMSRMVVFRPAAALAAGRRYTVTLGSQARYATDDAPAGPLTWSFSTASPELNMLGGEVTRAGGRTTVGGLSIYFGDLHSHTGFSDGAGNPAQAFLSARANGLDFFAVTDHGFLLSDSEWQDLKNQAQLATMPGQFVGIAGYEFTHAQGHLNVFGSDVLVHRDDPRYARLEDFYAWLVSHPSAFAQFNHPGRATNGNFADFAYDPVVDQKIILQELSTPAQFFLAMQRGWRLGSLLNSDTHWPNWGEHRYMGTLAAALTPEAIFEALRARRTFFVSPSDSNFVVVMRANGYWMGSSIPYAPEISFTINGFDPDPPGRAVRLRLYENGNLIASTTQNSAAVYTWTPTVSARLGHYYYVEAYYDGWTYPAYSSPIWVEQAPLAEAGPAQVVVAGRPFKLDAGHSWDPDGDALAYGWHQESGPAATVNQSQPLSPTLAMTAPDTPGAMQFRLTVTDPGGLQAADTVLITATDQPYLQISKTGPKRTEPGELINYTLTVTNIGRADAAGVLITDTIPAGATYAGGGSLQPGNIVAWQVPAVAANGGVAQVSFAVTASGPVVNRHYGATCSNCVPAIGQESVATNEFIAYLPLLFK